MLSPGVLRRHRENGVLSQCGRLVLMLLTEWYVMYLPGVHRVNKRPGNGGRSNARREGETLATAGIPFYLEKPQNHEIDVADRLVASEDDSQRIAAPDLPRPMLLRRTRQTRHFAVMH